MSLCCIAIAQPLHEVRAVWLTTLGGLDWPHSYAQSAASAQKQQRELCAILDQLQKANINTILFQARLRGTTTYDSKDEPWDGCLSGFPGKSPGYDALEFAINECHRRGMECHAWVVTIPCGKWNGTGCKSLRQKQPGLLMKIGDEGYLDPSNPKSGDYLASICGDITRRYDVDGIHLDYIRFPETMKKLPPANRGREQITSIVRKIHSAIKKEKGWVRLSCSPIGKHDDLRRYWSHGWNARKAVLQDAQAWMRDGLMDMEFPMMYFKGNNFYPFAIDWQEHSYGKQMVPGLGIYFMHPKEKNWPLIDITRELYVMRQYGMGHCFFRSKFLTDNTKGLYDFLCNEFNRYPALMPAKHGNPYRCPSAPKSVKTVNMDGRLYVMWDGAKDNSDGSYLMYNVFASNSYPVDVSNPENILAMRVRGEMLEQTLKRYPSHVYFAVSAVDRYGNESTACQMSVAGDTKVTSKPGWYWVTHPLGDAKPTKKIVEKGKKKKRKR